MKEGKGIFISVIVSDYSRREYIMGALESVVNQTLSQDYYEVILVKNFSDQDIDKFTMENKIHSVLSKDASLSGKIKEGLSIARGNVICFLDDDDMFYRNKLEYVYNKFKMDEQLGYLHNNFSAINVSGKSINYQNSNPDFNMSSISVRIDTIKNCNLTAVSKSIDTLLYLCALESRASVELDNTVLTYYRVTENSVTHSFDSFDSFKTFSTESLEKILQSYIQMKSMFKSIYAIKILKHRISFTRIRIHLFGGKRPRPGDYLTVLLTSSTESKSYEVKVLISSILLKNYAIKKLYENENKKKEFS